MRRALIIFIVAFMLLPRASADEVVLKNGDRITGEVARLDGGTLLVKTEALGDVRVKWDAIAKVEAEKPFHIVADGATVEAQGVERGDTADIIFTSGDAAFTVTPGRIVAVRSTSEQAVFEQRREREEHPQLLDRWSGTLDAGLSAARGNADTTNVSLGLKGAHTSDNARLSLMFTSLLARSRTGNGSTLTSANAVRSAARYEINVNDRMFTFGFGNFESDRVQHLDLRTVIGGGAGLRVSQSARGTMDIFTGASMNSEKFATATTPDRRTGELLFGHDMSYSLSSRTAFGNRFSLFPNLTMPGEYRAVLDTNATTRLNSWLGWQVTLSNIYVSNPPAGARTNDLLLSTGLRFNLGQERPFKPHSKVLNSSNPTSVGYK